MTTIVAAAGGGNWSATGTWVGGVVPTATSDVQLNATSGNVTIDVASACRSLDCTGYVSVLTHNAFTLSIGDATAGLSNIALKLVAGMTYTLTNALTSAISFISTNATLQSIDYAGKTIGNQNLTGVGSNYYYASAVTTSTDATIAHTAGTFHLDGATDNAAFTHNIGKLSSTGSLVRHLNGGFCNFNILTNSGATNTAWTYTVTGSNNATASLANMTLTSNRTFASASYVICQYNCAGTTIGKMEIIGNREHAIIGGTFTTFIRTGIDAQDQTLIFNGTLAIPVKVTGSLTITGFSHSSRVIVWPTTSADRTTTNIDVRGATINLGLGYVNMQDLSFNNGGVNLDFSGLAGIVGNAGANTEINGANVLFDVGVNCTWQGTTGGNWSNPAKWSPRAPVCQDNALFPNAFSATQDINVDIAFPCMDIDFTGGTGAATTLTANPGGPFFCHVGGSIKLRTGLSMTNQAGKGWIWFPRKTVTWTQNGGTLITLFTFQGGSLGTLNLLSNMRMGSDFAFRNGTVNQNGFDIEASRLLYSQNNTNPANVPLVHNGGTGNYNFFSSSGTLITYALISSCTINCSDMFFKFNAASASARTLDLGGKVWGGVTLVGGGGAVILDTSNGESALNKIYSPVAATLTLTAGKTFRIGDGAGRGFDNGANTVTLNSSAGGSPSTLKKNLGVFQGKNLSIQDITATGGATFYADTSTNVSGNAGWNFSAYPTIDSSFLAMSL